MFSSKKNNKPSPPLWSVIKREFPSVATTFTNWIPETKSPPRGAYQGGQISLQAWLQILYPVLLLYPVTKTSSRFMVAPMSTSIPRHGRALRIHCMLTSQMRRACSQQCEDGSTDLKIQPDCMGLSKSIEPAWNVSQRAGFPQACISQLYVAVIKYLR